MAHYRGPDWFKKEKKISTSFPAHFYINYITVTHQKAQKLKELARVLHYRCSLTKTIRCRWWLASEITWGHCGRPMNADAEDTSTSERKVEMTPLREDSKGTAEGAKKDKRYRCTTSAAKSSMDGMDDAKPTVKSSDPSQNSTSGNSNDSSVQQVDDTTPKANSPDQCQNTDKLEDVNEQSQPGLRYALSSVPPEDFGSFVKRHDNSLSFPEKVSRNRLRIFSWPIPNLCCPTINICSWCSS